MNQLQKKINSIRKRITPISRLFLRLKTRQVIIEQKGGLASQLGLYVFGEYLRKYGKKTVTYDLSWFENDGMDILGKNSRKWELENCFDLEIPKADRTTAELLKKWVSRRAKNQFMFDRRIELSPPRFSGYLKCQLLNTV